MGTSPKIVICGAGIAGIAAAYYLAVEHGRPDITIVEEGNPLSLTSDKSTEAYRNWWPGPDRAMTAFMNRSIDLMEEIARATGNRINMNRRGYLFATGEAGKVAWLREMVLNAEARGGGPARMHDTPSSPYAPSPERGFDFPLYGRGLHHRHELDPPPLSLPHVRDRGGRARTARRLAERAAARDDDAGGHPRDAASGSCAARWSASTPPVDGSASVHVEQQGARYALEATHLVLAAGPMLKETARFIGVELPIVAERHLKISLPDRIGAVPRGAPMLIWLDEQHLPWSEEERAASPRRRGALAVCASFPAGVHGRPDGSGAGTTLLILFNYENSPVGRRLPPAETSRTTPKSRCAACRPPCPRSRLTSTAGARPYIDGGYYIKTRENRPLIGPLPVEGAYVSGAYSGFGVMASCAGGELLARHVPGTPCRTMHRHFCCRATRTTNTAPCWRIGATADSFDTSIQQSPGAMPLPHGAPARLRFDAGGRTAHDGVNAATPEEAQWQRRSSACSA